MEIPRLLVMNGTNPIEHFLRISLISKDGRKLSIANQTEVCAYVLCNLQCFLCCI